MKLFILLSLVAYTVSQAAVCNNGFTLVNSAKCLKLVTTPTKHRSAEADCGRYGGTLVTIRNAIDNRAVTTFVGNIGLSFWIGVYCITNDPTTCYFDDDLGTASAYNNFARGFPNTDLGGCVYSASSGSLAGQWISSECEDVEMAYVCEAPTTKTDSCAHNYNGYCYLTSHENATSASLPFTAAQDACRQNCGELVSIHSRRENSYVQNLYSNTNISAFLIGALTTAPLTPYWIDQSRWDYGHVSPRSGSTGSCFQMTTGTDGTWYQVDCKASQYFLCKRPAGTVCNSTPPPPVIVTPAPTNPSGCNSTSLFGSGTLTSPNYPSTYPNVAYCVYKLTTLGAYRISLYFTDFSTYSYTYVSVYDSNGTRLAQLTGAPTLSTYYSSANTMTVSFGASANSGYRGFYAKFLSF